MKKLSKIIAMALCLSITFSCVGCSKSNDSDSGSASDSTSDTAGTSDKLKEDGTIDYNAYVDLCDYKNVSLKEEDIKKKTDETITNGIMTTDAYTKKKSGKLKKGDIVNIFFDGKIDGKSFEGGTCNKKEYPDGYDLELGSDSVFGEFKGFEDGLIGKEIGKKHKVNVTMPENAQEQDGVKIAGKKAVYEVTINYVKVFSKLTDEITEKNLKTYIEYYNENYGRNLPITAEGYTTYVREGVIGDLIWEKVLADSKVKSYPEQMLKDMTNEMSTSIKSYVAVNGSDFESYLKEQNMTEKEFEKQMEKAAEEEIAGQLVYYAIADNEGITVTDEEYKKELNTYMSNFGQETEEGLNDYFKQTYGSTATQIIYDDVTLRKVKFYLMDNYVKNGDKNE